MLKRMYLSFVFVIMFIVNFESHAHAQSQENIHIQTAAKEYLNRLSRCLFLEKYGYISSDEDGSFLRLGKKYGRYVIDRSKYNSYTANNFESILLFVEWCIPVFYNDDLRFIILVKKRDGEWRGIGDGEPPAFLAELYSNWAPDDGYTYTEIMNIPGIYFYKIERESQSFYYPGNSLTGKTFNLEKGADKLYPVLNRDQIVNKIQKMDNEIKSHNKMELEND